MEGEWTQIKKERKEDNYKGREINRELEKQIKTDTEKERMIEGERMDRGRENGSRERE